MIVSGEYPKPEEAMAQSKPTYRHRDHSENLRDMEQSAMLEEAAQDREKQPQQMGQPELPTWLWIISLVVMIALIISVGYIFSYNG